MTIFRPNTNRRSRGLAKVLVGLGTLGLPLAIPTMFGAAWVTVAGAIEWASAPMGWTGSLVVSLLCGLILLGFAIGMAGWGMGIDYISRRRMGTSRTSIMWSCHILSNAVLTGVVLAAPWGGLEFLASAGYATLTFLSAKALVRDLV